MCLVCAHQPKRNCLRKMILFFLCLLIKKAFLNLILFTAFLTMLYIGCTVYIIRPPPLYHEVQYKIIVPPMKILIEIDRYGFALCLFLTLLSISTLSLLLPPWKKSGFEMVSNLQTTPPLIHHTYLKIGENGVTDCCYKKFLFFRDYSLRYISYKRIQMWNKI